MANTILTHKMIAREAAAMLEEQVPFLSRVNRAREDDFGKPVNGINKGDYVDIRIPANHSVYDGSVFAGGGSPEDKTETSVRLQISTQKHIPLRFTAVEKVLSLSDFKTRFLQPAMEKMGAVVHADLLRRAVQSTPNLVGTPGTMPTTMKVWGQAGAIMSNGLAPDGTGGRSAITSHDIQTEMVDTSKALFNPDGDISKQYREGYVGRAGGFNFFDTASCPTLTNGNKVSGVTVSGASQSGSSLLVGGLASGDTFKKGQVFSIANVYSVHPLTGDAYPAVRQFVVTEDVTSTGTTATLPIYPAINATAPNATVNALPAAAAALTFAGAASTGYRQNLAYHRDAFTLAFVPLPVLASCEGYTFKTNDFSVRVMTFGDGVNDLENTRIDVLYGFASVRGVHACRVTE